MRYHASIGGRQRTIDIEPIGGSRYRVALDDGDPHVVDAERVEPRVLSLLAGDRSCEIIFEQDGEEIIAELRGQIHRVELLDERRHRLRQARGAHVVTGPVVVRAPMPGKIVKILVQPGQQVEEQQGLIIIEAMKMENELRSPKAGVVRQVHATEGQTVESRAELVSIE